MNHKKTYVLVAVLVALVAVPAQAITFDFFQIDWLADPSAPVGDGTYVSQDSDWGRVEIGLTSGDDALFWPMTLADGTAGFGGFVNVFTDAGGSNDWEIYNLPVFYEDPSELDGRLPQGVHFDLGVTPGTDVAALNYDYSIHGLPQPTSNPPPATLPHSASVNVFDLRISGDVLYLDGSLLEGGGMTSPQAAMDFPAAESGEVIGSRASISMPENQVAPVNEDDNGCAPGSVARSIKYMSDTHDNVNVPAGAQTVYGQLYNAMGTTANGTFTDKILSGKNAFVKANNLPIVSTQTKNFKKAMDTLKNEGDVEIGVHWGKKADGKSAGAHRAFVSEVQELQDANGNTTGYVVRTVDDPEQGDNTAENKTHTMKFDANGNLLQYDGKGAKTGARLINFQTEDIHASTVTIEFWGGTYTYPIPPGGQVPGPIGIPAGRPGEVVEIGGVTITFEGVSSPAPHPMLNSELKVNTEPAPGGKTSSLDMALDVELEPMEPFASTVLNVGLSLGHLQPDGMPGEFILPIDGEDDILLQNFVASSSFFDVTYEVAMEGEDPQIYRLHGEVAEPFLESVWLETEQIDDPDFWIESFFDVSFDLNVLPEAYPELMPLPPGPLLGPGTTLMNFELTAVQVPEPGTIWLLAVGGLAALLFGCRRFRGGK